MALETSKVRSILNDLVETCKDGENGFRDAAEHVKATSMKTLFTELSAQRSKFASELQAEVAKLGGEAAKSGTAAAAAHRGWINLKAAITGKDDHAILAECERGEDSAVKHYREALTHDLPGEVHSLLEKQYANVQKAHDRVRALRDHTSTSSAV